MALWGVALWWRQWPFVLRHEMEYPWTGGIWTPTQKTSLLFSGSDFTGSADALAAEAAELDPSLPVTIELDPEAVHFQLKGSWMEWDARRKGTFTESCCPEGKTLAET